jgi:hypothetical protein
MSYFDSTRIPRHYASPPSSDFGAGLAVFFVGGSLLGGIAMAASVGGAPLAIGAALAVGACVVGYFVLSTREAEKQRAREAPLHEELARLKQAFGSKVDPIIQKL